MFKPCGHRLIVHRDPIVTQSSGGIILTSNVQQEKLEKANVQLGVIVDLGPDCWKAFRKIDENGNEVEGKHWAEAGDYVLFAKYAGRNVIDPFTPDNEDIVILNDEDIICVITPEKIAVPTDTVRDKLGEN